MDPTPILTATASRALAVEAILRSWLADPDLTLFCGDWRQGGIMELLPRGRALLSGGRYDPPFDGLRELRLEGDGHHVHLDLGRLTKVRYVVAPSVCYGFRPSFELRFTGDDAGLCDGFGLGLALSAPYAGRSLRAGAVRRYLRRAAEHVQSFPGVACFACDHTRLGAGTLPVWREVAALLGEFEALSDTALPALRASLQSAAAAATVL